MSTIIVWSWEDSEVKLLKKFAKINGLKISHFTFENEEYMRVVFASSENNFFHGLSTLTPAEREHRKKFFDKFVNYKIRQQLLDSLIKLEKLNDQKCVKKINIQLLLVDYEVDSEVFMSISKVGYLQDISFSDCSLDFDAIESYLTSSTNFCLGFSRCTISPKTIDSISLNKCIKWINMSNVNLSEEMFVKLCTTPNITRMELTRVIKNDQWIKYLVYLKELQYLKILRLGIVHNDSAHEFSKLQSLITLEIGGCDLTQADLSFLEKLPNIKKFIISHTKLKQSQMLYIENFSNIKIVHK
jgi:hypothetical protein